MHHDKLYEDHVKQLLWKIPGLKPHGQEYLKAMLMRYIRPGKTGITSAEVEKVISDLEHDSRDELNLDEVAQVAKVLREYFTISI